MGQVVGLVGPGRRGAAARRADGRLPARSATVFFFSFFPPPRGRTRRRRYVYAHWSEAGCDASLALLAESYRPWDSPFDHPLPWASHGSDIASTFGNDFGPDGLSGATPTPRQDCPKTREEVALSDALQDYWAAFARTGRPDRPGDAEPNRWRRNAVRKLAARADGGLANLDGFKRDDCAFWATVQAEVNANAAARRA